MTIALETRALEKHFGGLRVTRELSLKVERGARHALIGPNGAGKTTVINLLTGVLRPDSGRILLEGTDITDLPVHTRVLRGLSRTFQINQLYADLTPLETIGLAVSERLGRGGDWWRRMGTRDDVNVEIAENLARFHLLDVMNEPTATLPYGKQRLLEIALAIAAKPRVLLLDEPAAGVPESERHDILAAVSALPRDVTVLLIEHDMDLVFSLRRPDLGAGQRRPAGRGRTGRGGAGPAGQGGLSRRGGLMADLLAIEGLRAGYGEAVVLPNLSLPLPDGQVLALLGRNGTGKTTLINSIVGVTRRFGGTIALDGRDITPMRPDQRARAGIGWVPQERNIFRSLTVEENMTAVAQPGPVDGRKGLRDVSAAEGAARQFRQPALRRRTADAGGRPGADAQSESAAARRADRGAGADHRRGVAEGARHHRPLGRASARIIVEQNAQKILRARRPGCDIGTRHHRARCAELRPEGRSDRAGAPSRRRPAGLGPIRCRGEPIKAWYKNLL